MSRRIPKFPPLNVTDDKNCPLCRPHEQPNYCEKHDWAYRKWWENFRSGTSR